MTSDRAAAADLRTRVLAEAARTSSSTRAEYKRRALLVAGVGAVATAALFVGMGGMSPGTRPFELIAFTVGVALVGVAVLTRLSSGEQHSMLGRPRSVLLAGVVLSAPLLAISAVAAAFLWPEPAAEHVGGGVHLACGAISVAQGALPLIVLMLPRRGSDPVHPAVTGAALGMTAGAWTVVMAYLRCPHAAAVHCVLAHVVPTLILTGLGAVLGWLLLRVRSTMG